MSRHAASFRDPAGFVFEQEGELFRAVHPDAAGDVNALYACGLHDELAAAGLLVAHRPAQATTAHLQLPQGWLVLKPERLAVISYACEWTDAQLLEAARLTLEVQRRALGHGLSLKDASSFNVQFAGSRPVFIDLLSFTQIGKSRAWPAYRQFCEHFLAPLALRRHAPGATGVNVGLEGVALAVASSALPGRTWLSPSLGLHVHLHARAAAAGTGRKRVVAGDVDAKAITDYRQQLASSLSTALDAVRPRARDSAWAGYRSNNVYSSASAERKLQFVRQVVVQTGARRALDLGANDGHYARALVDIGVACTAVELDAACAERIHASGAESPYDRLLNTVKVDLTNPTPAHGWAHKERASFTERMRCDLTLSLALMHHLSITHQIPFDEIASFLADLAPAAIVEYVPVTDPMSQQLLEARTGVTKAYLETLSESSLQSAFAALFDCRGRSEPLEGGRVLYRFERRR